VTLLRELLRPVAHYRNGRYRACLYCGAQCAGLSCAAHRDLLLEDPHTYLMSLGRPPEGDPQ
jgi:hypothetical protein